MSFGPECHYVRFNGKRCGSPALRGKVFCYHHARTRTAQRNNVVVPEFDSAQAALFAGRNLLNLMLNRKITVSEYRASVYGMRYMFDALTWCNFNADTETEVSRHVAHEIAFAGPDADPEEETQVKGRGFSHADSDIENGASAPALAQALTTAQTNDAAVEQSLSPVAPPLSETPQLSTALSDPFIPGPGDLNATDLHQRRPILRPTKLPPASDPDSLVPMPQDRYRPPATDDGSYPRRTTDALRDYLEHEYRKRGFGT